MPNFELQLYNFTMKKFFLLLLSSLAVFSVRGQEMVVNAYFETLFDNREYSTCDFGESTTIFGLQFIPEVGIQWAEKNRLMVGMDLTHDFGSEMSASAINLILYYQFTHPNWSVNAGIFSRSKLIGKYSEAFFDENTLFYHDPLQGLSFNYHSTTSNSYAEFFIDWEGMRTETQREKFRIAADGRWDNGKFYAGGSAMMLHYAKTLLEESNEGVVDNILVNPYVGMRLNGSWAFDARLGYLQSLQRDRVTEQGWLTPKGGELWLRLSRWNFSLDNKLYVGEDIIPLYDFYGYDVYESSSFYGTTEKIYNRTALSYSRKFFKDTLSLYASFAVHYDGVGVGLQQLLRLEVNFEKLFFKSKK